MPVPDGRGGGVDIAGWLRELGLEQYAPAFRENDIDLPLGYKIGNPQWDNDYGRTYQAPNTQEPSAPQNTVQTSNYLLDFRRGCGVYLRNVR